ncbi:uncharacterized protein VTP21DRAFT_6528 [Calcarisporiella thermophila]|uniref:uncharacterized protein n=1 Tax=Calcarisporiella thermophila TaxID=911321 RepID=UPI003744121F
MQCSWLFTVLVTLSLLHPSLSSTQPFIPLQTHSIYPPYIDQELQSRWWDFGGDAIVNTMKYVRLTSDQPSQSGYLWSRLPLSVENFEIEFEFHVSSTRDDHLYGDGFGLFLTTQRAEVGPVFGFRDRFNGLGIFFDSYQNSRRSGHSFPYVMAMLGDGETSYDHDEDGMKNALVGCESDFRDTENPAKGRITYYQGEFLELQLNYGGDEDWTHCFTITNLTLPEHSYLGFSAHTGDISDNHDIISVTTHALSSQVAHDTPMHTQVLKKSYFSLWSFLKFASLGALATFGGVYWYKRHKENSLKRF